MKCNICLTETRSLGYFSILRKYDIQYYRCPKCGFTQTEKPYWLEEAYSEAITFSDVGLLSRNLTYSYITQAVITLFFDANARFLDFGAGYGVFVRIMRDRGFDYYWHDPVCPNTSYHYNRSFWNILLWRTVPYVILRSLYDRFARYPETEVFFVSGACLMIRRELFERLGGYDKTYFLCVEDAADLCLRARKEGYSTVFYPEARIVHMTGRSREGINYFARILNYNGCIYYLRKHYGAAPSAGIWMVLLVTSLVKVWVNWMLALFFPARRQFATIYALLVRDLLSGRLLRADLSENGVHVISDELTLKTKR